MSAPAFQEANSSLIAGPMAAGQATPRISVQLSPSLPALLLPAGAVSQIAIDPALSPVPNCHPWFRGVYGMRGTLVPVFDVACAIGLDPVDLRGGTVLVIDPGRKPLGLACIQAPEVVMTTACEPQPLPAELAPLATYVGHPVMSRSGPIFEFNIHAWITAAARQLVRSA